MLFPLVPPAPAPISPPLQPTTWEALAVSLFAASSCHTGVKLEPSKAQMEYQSQVTSDVEKVKCAVECSHLWVRHVLLLVWGALALRVFLQVTGPLACSSWSLKAPAHVAHTALSVHLMLLWKAPSVGRDSAVIVGVSVLMRQCNMHIKVAILTPVLSLLSHNMTTGSSVSPEPLAELHRDQCVHSYQKNRAWLLGCSYCCLLLTSALGHPCALRWTILPHNWQQT